jgi:nitrogen fixation protein FixH
VTRGFTGWHMLAAMIAFFGVVIGVNMVMATAATRTFGGKVVENSYVATQKFNGWLDQAAAQRRLGWTLAAAGAKGRATVRTVAGARLTGIAVHPLGRMDDQTLTFAEEAPGRYVAHQLLPKGRWELRLVVRRGADQARYLEELAL